MNREWLNAKKVAAWIEGERPNAVVECGESYTRALYRWKHCEKGGQVNFYDLDKNYLVKLDLHEWEIPDDAWEPKKKRNTKRTPARKQAERMLREGHSIVEVRAYLNDLGEWASYDKIDGWRRVMNGYHKVSA